jgi:hypothetical protein
VFVWRSFYAMRIPIEEEAVEEPTRRRASADEPPVGAAR